jgi:hypothetical protein
MITKQDQRFYMRPHFFIAPIVPNQPSREVLPEERDDFRRTGSGVVLYAVSGGRMTDPGTVFDNGFSPHSSQKHEIYPLKIGGKTRFHDGQQYIAPDDLAMAAINTADSKIGKDMLLVVNYQAGMVTPELNPDIGRRAKLMSATTGLFKIDEMAIDPKISESSQANIKKLQDAARYHHVRGNNEFALCGLTGAASGEDRDRLTRLATEVLANISGLITNPVPDGVRLSFAGGGSSDPAARATQSAFAHATRSRADQPHQSYGWASADEVQRLVDLPVGSKRAALIGDIHQREQDHALATSVPDALDTWDMSDGELDKKHPWDAVYVVQNQP